LFVAAIIVGNDAGLSKSDMNLVAGGYLALRTVYNFLYITVDRERNSHWRYSPRVPYIAFYCFCCCVVETDG